MCLLDDSKPSQVDIKKLATTVGDSASFMVCDGFGGIFRGVRSRRGLWRTWHAQRVEVKRERGALFGLGTLLRKPLEAQVM